MPRLSPLSAPPIGFQVEDEGITRQVFNNMFYLLLLSTFVIASGVSWITVRVFTKPAGDILKRIIQDEIYASWLTYLRFALYVVGISSGVRLPNLEQYVKQKDAKLLELTPERCILEIYRTVIDVLQGMAWVLFVFFVVALLSFVLVRIFELKRLKKEENHTA